MKFNFSVNTFMNMLCKGTSNACFSKYYFPRHICLVNLGGPEFCKEALQPNYTLSSKVSPVISVVLCGVPPPILHWRFIDSSNVMATRKTIKSYTYEYLIHLPKLTQKTCGGELVLIATGKVVSKWRRQLFLAKCKYQKFFL